MAATSSKSPTTEMTSLSDGLDYKKGKDKDKLMPSAESPPGSPSSPSKGSSNSNRLSKAPPAFQAKFFAETRKQRKALKKAKTSNPQEYKRIKKGILHKCAPKVWKSKSARAKTAFPVDKLKKRLRKATPSQVTVTTEAAVCLAAALDYAVTELVDVTSKAADLKKQRVMAPRHIKLGVPQDESLYEMFKNVTIPQGGVVPHFHPELAQGYAKRKQMAKFTTGTEFSDKFSDASVDKAKGKRPFSPTIQSDSSTQLTEKDKGKDKDKPYKIDKKVGGKDEKTKNGDDKDDKGKKDEEDKGKDKGKLSKDDKKIGDKDDKGMIDKDDKGKPDKDDKDAKTSGDDKDKTDKLKDKDKSDKDKADKSDKSDKDKPEKPLEEYPLVRSKKARKA
jgi:hypothetical protein